MLLMFERIQEKKKNENFFLRWCFLILKNSKKAKKQKKIFNFLNNWEYMRSY